MNRRHLLALLTSAAMFRAIVVKAQPAAKVPRIGYLGTDLTDVSRNQEALRQGLRDLGYIEGRNLVIEYRDAQRKLERLPALAAELVALKVDAIVGAGTLVALAAKQATNTLPIVFIAVGDPVSSGLVASLDAAGRQYHGLVLRLPGACREAVRSAHASRSRGQSD